jgi:hypothetical protein
MPSNAGALRLVDPETGVVHEDGCPHCFRKDDVIAGLERDIRGWAHRYAILKREKDAEARAHKLWPEAIRLFEEWKARCNHPRSEWTPDRFWLVEPFLRKDGYDMCLRAIKGAAFDPWTKRRRNGSFYRHDWWDDIFSSKPTARKIFENLCNAAPREADVA